MGVNEIVNLGFSVFVAVFLLTRLDKTLQSLIEAINSFKTLILELTNANQDNFDEAKEQSEFLKRHDEKLDNLISEVGKIPKRGEKSG